MGPNHNSSFDELWVSEMNANRQAEGVFTNTAIVRVDLVSTRNYGNGLVTLYCSNGHRKIAIDTYSQ